MQDLGVPMRGGKEAIALLIIIIIVLSALIVINAIPDQVSAYTLHDPILINRNSDFTAANGVSGGSGTTADPFIIDEWEINYSQFAGIYLSHTTEHLIIKNTKILADYQDSAWLGIYLENCSNITVENNLISGNQYGITLLRCMNIIIENNAFENRKIAIYSGNSTNITIINNDASGHFAAIVLNSCSDSEILNNMVSDNWEGIELFHCRNVSILNNEIIIVDNYYPILKDLYGIFLSDSENISIENNDISNIDYKGMRIKSCANVTLIGNDVIGNKVGIEIEQEGYNFSIINNNIAGNSEIGIIIDICVNGLISGNNIENNHIGIVLEESNDFTVIHNNFFDNTYQAYEIPSGSNQWDSGLSNGGNFWSDYDGIDSNEDGFGDTPYTFIGNQDNYPMMKPYSSTIDRGLTEYWPLIAITIGIVMTVALLFYFFRPKKGSPELSSIPPENVPQ